MNNNVTYTLDNVPFNKFHGKLAAYTLGGSFIDGYILGIIEFALVLLIPALDMNSTWQGLIGSSPLIGIFIGALFLGRLADAIGRKKLYTLDFLVIIIASLLQFFVGSPATLFIIRVLLGIAIGAEYAIGPSLQAEFMPIKYRAPLLSFLNIAWTVGYFASAIVGYVLANDQDNWRWMLASSAVPALIFFLMRIGSPESPRWLISQGRVEEARAVVRKHVGENVTIDDILAEAPDTTEHLGYRHLFGKKLWKQTLFVCIFWVGGGYRLLPDLHLRSADPGGPSHRKRTAGYAVPQRVQPAGRHRRRLRHRPGSEKNPAGVHLRHRRCTASAAGRMEQRAERGAGHLLLPLRLRVHHWRYTAVRISGRNFPDRAARLRRWLLLCP